MKQHLKTNDAHILTNLHNRTTSSKNALKLVNLQFVDDSKHCTLHTAPHTDHRQQNTACRLSTKCHNLSTIKFHILIQELKQRTKQNKNLCEELFNIYK